MKYFCVFTYIITKDHALFLFYFTLSSNLLIHFLETPQELTSLIGKTGHKTPLIVVANELDEPVLSNDITMVAKPPSTLKDSFVHGYDYEYSGSEIAFYKTIGHMKRFTLAFWIYPTKNYRHLLQSKIYGVGYFFNIWTDEFCYTEYVNI